MRVYEISKQLNIPSKELIDALIGHGFEVQNHMSALSAEAVKFLQKEFGSKEKKLLQAPSQSKKKFNQQLHLLLSLCQ